MKFLTKFLLMFALVLTMNLNVQAQESAPTLAIEEIIVTARKKEEQFTQRKRGHSARNAKRNAKRNDKRLSLIHI